MSIQLQDLSGFRFRNVLVADDEPAVHEMYQIALQPARNPDAPESPVSKEDDVYNFSVFHALNGREAVDLAIAQEKRRRPIQMAFIDMRMPVLDGIGTMRELHNLDPRISFVVVTGFAAQTHIDIAETLGAMPIKVLSKPAELEELYRSAHELVARWNRIHSDY